MMYNIGRFLDEVAIPAAFTLRLSRAVTNVRKSAAEVREASSASVAKIE